MISFCGLDCSKCVGYIATQSGNEGELKDVAEKWSIQFNSDIKPEDVICDGCKNNGRHSFHCENSCHIRKCCVAHDFQSCKWCEDYPCGELNTILENASEARDNLEGSIIL